MTSLCDTSRRASMSVASSKVNTLLTPNPRLLLPGA